LTATPGCRGVADYSPVVARRTCPEMGETEDKT
jgi:hypothetical protein